MKTEDAKIIINNYLKTLGYDSVEESLNKNLYGKKVNVECNDLDRMNNIVNDLLNDNSYQEISKKIGVSAPRINDIVTNYINSLKVQINTQNLMIENYINETNINDEVTQEEFMTNYLKVLRGEYPDKYYLYLPAESLDLELTDTYSTSLFDLLVNRKHKLNNKIEKNPVLLFNRLKEMYTTMDYDDRDRLELLPVVSELQNKIDYPIELDDRTNEEKLFEIEQQMKRLERKHEKITKKLIKSKK